MSNGHELDKPMTYVIRVGGELDSKWSDCFRGFAIHSKPDHETLLTGSVDDQGVLYGILLKIHNLGLVLLSVERQADAKIMHQEYPVRWLLNLSKGVSHE